jgi:hypothetical protein
MTDKEREQFRYEMARGMPNMPDQGDGIRLDKWDILYPAMKEIKALHRRCDRLRWWLAFALGCIFGSWVIGVIRMWR